MDRREFLITMGGAAAIAGANGAAEASSAALPELPLKQQPLRFGDVKLTSGLLHDRWVLNTQRTFAIPSEDILMPFFRAKGLSNGGKELNGVYAPKLQTGTYPGLYSAMWMCGAAQMARWSGDPAHQQQLAHMVHQLAETKEPDGFLLAMGRARDERWAHTDLFALVRSTVRCLLDIYEVTGDPLALELARGQMDCVYNDLEKHTGPGGGIVLRGTENAAVRPVSSNVVGPYKLVPACAQLFQHTGDDRYLELAEMCVDLKLVNSLLEGSKTDPLIDHHASTWADFLMGIYQIGLMKGNQQYTEAALKGWALIREQHMFITGNSGSGESWRSGSHGWQLRETEHAQETCAAFSWVCLEQALLHGTGDMAHADCIEAAAYNDLFAAQDPATGNFCYYLNLQGKDKPYDPPPAYGYHCCDGNGLTAIGRLAGLIYGKTADGIAINLYAGSEAVSDGVKITQETDFPVSGSVLIRVEPGQPRQFTLRYRIPSWASSHTVELNGNRVEGRGSMAREWKAGDTVRLEFPMERRAVYDKRIGVVRLALQRGPIVYAAIWSDDLPVTMSRPMPSYGVHSGADVWPCLPTVVASSVHDFEAEAVTAADPSGPPGSGARIAVRYQPFYAIAEGKYSVWLPAAQI